jgi:glycosyltransferase involved in cell wall biosynthesis
LPLVSVVTPVFNGAKYLRRCIESVIAQSYDNWDYTIVDNCSTDASVAIATEYAEKYPQITVKINKEFVGSIDNHNRAFRSLSREAVYCKPLSADDWLYPECIAQLVDLAERHPSVGMVGSWTVDGTGVRWSNVPFDEEVLSGRNAARLYLLGEIDTFWLPSGALYRAPIVRARDPFFPGFASSADLEACLNCLKESDLGFVHQILSFQRVHDEATTARVAETNVQLLDRIRILKEFGPAFLSPREQERRLEEQLSQYFEVLASRCFQFRDREFRTLHRQGLAELGYSLYDGRFAKAICARFLDLTLNPKATTEKTVRRLKSTRYAVRP